MIENDFTALPLLLLLFLLTWQTQGPRATCGPLYSYIWAARTFPNYHNWPTCIRLTPLILKVPECTASARAPRHSRKERRYWRPTIPCGSNIYNDAHHANGRTLITYAHVVICTFLLLYCTLMRRQKSPKKKWPNEKWTLKTGAFKTGGRERHLFTRICRKAVCLVCGTDVAEFKEHNKRRHYCPFSTKPVSRPVPG